MVNSIVSLDHEGALLSGVRTNLSAECTFLVNFHTRPAQTPTELPHSEGNTSKSALKAFGLSLRRILSLKYISIFFSVPLLSHLIIYGCFFLYVLAGSAVVIRKSRAWSWRLPVAVTSARKRKLPP